MIARNIRFRDVHERPAMTNPGVSLTWRTACNKADLPMLLPQETGQTF
jgi:hypothetical protein